MPKRIQLVTSTGWEFWSSAEVLVGDVCYDMEELFKGQKKYVIGRLQEQAWNAAFGGQVRFQAQNIPADINALLKT